MPENDPLQSARVEAEHRSSHVMAWAGIAVVSFALGGLATYFSVLQLVSPSALAEFFRSEAWSIGSIALAAFTLGLGVAYFPYAWYRDDANRILLSELQELRKKTQALLASGGTTLSVEEAFGVEVKLRPDLGAGYEIVKRHPDPKPSGE